MFLPEVIDRACQNFAKFHQKARIDVNEIMINKVSPSLGIAGWSDPHLNVLDYGEIEREKSAREKSKATTSCFNFDTVDAQCDVDMSKQNTEVAKIIELLGKDGAGRRAILKAVALQQGVTSEDELEKLYDGTSGQQLRVPPSIREAMVEIGLGDRLVPINVITTSDPLQCFVNEEAWEEMEFEVALDSGSVVHVCALTDCPGYRLGESPGSRRKQVFMMGDGGEIPNLGETQLNLSDNEVGRDIQSVFQIAAVTRPLMSVGVICDQGHNVTFNKVMAVVHGEDGNEICRFHRDSGGLYVAKLKSRSPAGFGRRE